MFFGSFYVGVRFCFGSGFIISEEVREIFFSRFSRGGFFY